jgi:integrase
MSVKVSDFMVKLRDDLKKERDLSEASLNTYLSRLVSLNDKKPFNNMGFLKDREKIMEKLSEYADKTQENYLSAIVSSLSLFRDKHLYKSTYKFYYDTLKAKNSELNLIDPSIKTEKQKINWKSWDDILKIHSELAEKVKEFVGQKSLTAHQFDVLQQYTVLSLYLLMDAPRRNADFLHMYVVKSMPKEMDINKNYLDLENEEMIFNNYKTAKKYGTQTIKINEDLMTILNMYFKHHPHYAGNKTKEIKFLVNDKGQALNAENSITRILNAGLKANIGSSMLRHIYLSFKFPAEMFDSMEETADAMAHSVAEQKRYVKRDD